MEDDDEFGDLYSDVLPPFTTSVQSQHGDTGASKSSQSRPIDRSDDGDIIHGALELNNSFSNSNSGLGVEPNASIKEKTLARPELGRFDLNLDGSRIAGGNILGVEARGLEKGEGAKLPEKGAGGLNLMVDNDDLNIVVEEREQKDDEFVVKDVNFLDKQENVYTSAERNENLVENHDEWESDDSEDDLRILLDDNNVQIGMAAEEDEDGEALVIVADDRELSLHHQPTEMGGKELGADAERKELGNAAMTSGTVQPKIGYSNHMYHHPQFKYVRPGAAPIPGAASLSSGGTPGQTRPPITLRAVAGRGRSDWQPAGVGAIPMQKGLQPGYGIPVWGANAVGRGYGSRLDFTLPSHKTIFEVHIDGFEEKPWRVPGIDVSDFFNFGLNEESWKDYCKNLEQLRLGTCMQSKIRVYESGRGEQGYDPDLPPELAAAVGIQGIPSENANPGKADAAATDLARGSGRPSVPIGRQIPVETGSGDRLPSIDTRRPRMQDSDAVIEIICQSSADDDDQAEKQDNDPSEEDEVDDLQQDDVDCNHHFSHAYSGQKGELVAKSEQLKNTVNRDEVVGEDNLHVVSEAAVKYQPDRRIGFPYEESDHRSAKGRGHVKIPKMTASANSREKQVINDRDESFYYENGKQNPHLSSLMIVSDEENAAAVVDYKDDASVSDDRSFDTEREDMTRGATIADTCDDGKMCKTTKQKGISDVEQVSQENDDREDSKASRSSENSKARSGSSKDQRSFHDIFEDEVPQDRHHPQTGNSKRSVGDEEEDAHRRSRHGRDETRKHNMTVKEIEDPRSRRGGDPNSSLHRHMKSESTEWRKESDTSERSLRGRDEDLHGRRIRVEDIIKNEHGGEIGSRNRGKARESQSSKRDQHHPSRYQLESGTLRGVNRDHNTGSRQRDWYDNRKTQSAKLDDLLNKRRKEGSHINMEHSKKDEVNYNQREGSSHRKREIDDSSDQWKSGNNAKLKDNDIHNVKKKREGSLQKERGERRRDHDEWRRHKQLHEESLPRKEIEEKCSVMRSGRPVEDKTWNNHSRKSDDCGRSGKEYHSKDVGRHGEQPKRMDRIENGSFLQDTLQVHEDSYARGNRKSNDAMRARYKRVDRKDKCVVHASNTSRLYEHRQSKESESGDHGSSLISSKKNKDDHIGQISEKVNLRGITERGSVEDDIHMNQQSSGKVAEEDSSDDDHYGSRRGHSKSKHWMIHKEKDFCATPVLLATKISEEPPEKVEENQQPSVDDKNSGSNMNNAKAKLEDNHLDSVEKLNKRSERFKLPMPSEKEAMAKKSESLSSAQTENRRNLEIKSERPPRKRRWTGN
ncbi:FIP1[V]-like protein [Perilla frutescens var. frutescens]|nr:FIP1[V]-like protein [Perilla frutescens var. frutescens]